MNPLPPEVASPPQHPEGAPVPARRPHPWWELAAALLLWLICLLFLTSCASPRADVMIVAGPIAGGLNFHRTSERLPGDVRRVAVLPLTCDGARAVVAEGRDALEPVLRTELGKTRRFELVVVSPDTLRRLTGRNQWAADEALPADFFQALRAETGCDAVLFSRLTEFRPYPPLAVGWRLHLVDCRGAEEKEIWWAVDEVFDAGKDEVAAAAVRFHDQFAKSGQPFADTRTVLRSPRGFGQYAAATALGTMPWR
jgi:hypothetical protein